jgi:hypothetical protein
MWKSNGKTVRHCLLLPNQEQVTGLKRKEQPKEFSHAGTVLEDPAAHQAQRFLNEKDCSLARFARAHRGRRENLNICQETKLRYYPLLFVAL